MTQPTKPLGHKAYGSIPHLPGSRQGRGDKGLTEHQARILTEKGRDPHDLIIVEEKLDGANVAIAKIQGQLVPLTRSGWPASTSTFGHHQLFHSWSLHYMDRFNALLNEGERVCGEWLALAHGTRYKGLVFPFVAFDIMRHHTRIQRQDFWARAAAAGIPTARTIHVGGPISIKDVLCELEPSRHGAIDPVEGAVWRVERKGEFDFIGKYVRPHKVDGAYLPEMSGKDPVWNWTWPKKD